MIAARGLCKRFGALEVLDALDLDVAPGRVTAILGPNASGKTTFMKAVLGLVKPDAGTLRVGGTLVDGDPGYRADLGYMPQHARFPDNLTGREVLALLADLRGPGAEPDRSLVDALGLAGELDKPVGTLSGGTRQKLSAVVALLFRPRLLLLDEPTSGLDPLASAALKDRVLAERDRGTTVLLTTHVMADVDELADDVVYLLDGRVRWSGPRVELLRHTGAASVERAVARILEGEGSRPPAGGAAA